MSVSIDPSAFVVGAGSAFAVDDYFLVAKRARIRQPDKSVVCSGPVGTETETRVGIVVLINHNITPEQVFAG